MYFDDALARMADLVPDAKLVAILRDPVERLYSDYWYRLPLGETRSFAEVVRQEMAEGKPFHKTMRMGYLEAGRYVRHLRRVCEHYPRESLMVLLMDDMRSDPVGTFVNLCRFIGVDDGFRPRTLGRPANEAYTLRWPGLRRATWALQLGRRWKWLATRLEDLNRVPLNKPAMDAALRAELKEWYAADNAELAAWLGRDLSAWSS
jgi:sulfotransferase family protein